MGQAGSGSVGGLGRIPVTQRSGPREIAGREIAGREIAGREIAGREIAGHEIADCETSDRAPGQTAPAIERRSRSLLPTRHLPSSVISARQISAAVLLAASFAAASITVASFTDASAQNIPAIIDPSRVRDQVAPIPKRRTGGGVVVPRTDPKKKVDERLKRITFDLKAITITGSTAVSAARLRPLYAGMVGKKVSLADVFTLANRITAVYRNAGFILSQAVVPRQRIAGGVVRIHVVEGHIDKVVMQGASVLGQHDVGLIQAFGNKIAREKPLTRKALERYLLLANDVPGLTVKGILKPSKTKPGAADLIMDIREKTYDLWATFDNRGSRFLGPYQLEVGGALNSLFRLGDRTTIRLMSSIFETRELGYYEIRHQRPVGTDGLTFELVANYTKTKPGFTLKQFEIEGTSFSIAGIGRYPVIRSRARNLYVHVTTEWRQSENDLLGTSLSSDRTRQVRVGMTYDQVDRLRGVTLVDLTFHKGFDILGARGESRAGGRTNYSKLTVLIQRNQYIYRRISALVAVTGQYAGTNLLSSEEFGFGGRSFGQAFDSSTITGDHGLAVKGELRFSDTLPPKFLPWKLDFQLFAFIDWGKVWQKEKDADPAYDQAASFGFGLRFNLGKYVSGEVEAAKPFINENPTLGTKNRSWRFFFALTARY